MKRPLLADTKTLNQCILIINECSSWLLEQGMSHWSSYYNKEKIAEMINSPDFDVFLVKSDEGEPAATVTLSTKPPQYYISNQEHTNHLNKFSEPDKDAIYISALGVRPKYQGQGYAKALLNFAEENAKSNRLSILGSMQEAITLNS